MNIKDDSCQVKNNIIDMSMLTHIFNNPKERDSKTKPRNR